MTVIRALSTLPAPSGGAVQLTIHANTENVYALILASGHPEAPDPIMQDDARKVFGGKLRHRVRPGRVQFRQAPHAFLLLDLDSDALADGEITYYHAYELHPDGTYGPSLTISAIPRCSREAVVTLARDIVMRRLRYHARRAVAEGVVSGNVHEIPVLEQEVRAEGEPLPAIYVKERVSPNPSSDTVGHQAGQVRDEYSALGVKEYRFEYRASVDMLLLCDTPDERTDLEKFIRGGLDADRELFLHAGLEAPTISSFTRHDVSDDYDLYGAEISIEAGVTTRVTETVTQVQPAVVTR